MNMIKMNIGTAALALICLDASGQRWRHIGGWEQSDHSDSSTGRTHRYLTIWTGTNLYNQVEDITVIDRHFPASPSNCYVEGHYLWSHFDTNGVLYLDYHIQFLVSPTLPGDQWITEQPPLTPGIYPQRPSTIIANTLVVSGPYRQYDFCRALWRLENPDLETFYFASTYRVGARQATVGYVVGPMANLEVVIPYESLLGAWNEPISNYDPDGPANGPIYSSAQPRRYVPNAPVGGSLVFTPPPIPTHHAINEYLDVFFFNPR